MAKVVSSAPSVRLRMGVIGALLVAAAACSMDAPFTQPSSQAAEVRANPVFDVSIRRGPEMVAMTQVEMLEDLPATAAASWRPRLAERGPGERVAGRSRHLFLVSQAMDSLSRILPSGQVLRPRIPGRRFEMTLPDGTPAAAVVSRRMNGRTRLGEYTLAVYVKDQLRAIEEVAFRKRGGGMEILASRLTKFDSVGTIIATVEGTGAPTQVSRASVLDAPRDALSRLAGFLSPEDAHAAAMAEVPCDDEFLRLLGITIVAAVQYSAVTTAVVACMADPLLCPAVGPLALKLTGQSLGFIVALRALDRCLRENYWSDGLGDSLPPLPPLPGDTSIPPPVNPPCTSGGGDGDGSGGYDYLREAGSTCDDGDGSGSGGGGGGGGGTMRCITIDYFTVYPDGYGGYTYEWVDQVSFCFPLDGF